MGHRVDRGGPASISTRAASTRVPAEIVKSSTTRARVALDLADQVDDLGRLGVVGPLLVGDGHRGAQPLGVELGLLGEAGVRATRPPGRAGLAWRSPRRARGAAYRSSTGTRKKPCTWGACRSMVMTRSAPAASMASAHTRPGSTPGLVLLVALGVAEVRHQHGHRTALARLRASIQNSSSTKLSLAGNAVPCTRKTSALHVLGHPDEQVALGEPQRLALAERVVEVGGDGLRQAGVGGPGQQDEVVAHVAAR